MNRPVVSMLQRGVANVVGQDSVAAFADSQRHFRPPAFCDVGRLTPEIPIARPASSNIVLAVNSTQTVEPSLRESNSNSPENSICLPAAKVD